MKKRMLPFFIALACCLCPLSVFAAEGNIQLVLPEGMEGMEVRYNKEGEQEETAVVDGHDVVEISGLEVGTYHINIPETSDYTFSPIIVRVPTWSEEEHKMLYDIKINPKYTRNVVVQEVPNTGDESKDVIYAGVGLISLIIVVIMSCHNRLKCGRMSRKYSRKRRI